MKEQNILKKYKVTLYYHSSLTLEVNAENEKEAVEIARDEACLRENEEIMLESLIEDDSPDIILIPLETAYS